MCLSTIDNLDLLMNEIGVLKHGDTLVNDIDFLLASL